MKIINCFIIICSVAISFHTFFVGCEEEYVKIIEDGSPEFQADPIYRTDRVTRIDRVTHTGRTKPTDRTDQAFNSSETLGPGSLQELFNAMVSNSKNLNRRFDPPIPTKKLLAQARLNYQINEMRKLKVREREMLKIRCIQKDKTKKRIKIID